MNIGLAMEHLPELYRPALSVEGAYLFGRLIAEHVSRLETVYAWEGGPVAVDTLANFRRIAAHAAVLFPDGVEPKPVALYQEPGGERVALWARFTTDEHGQRRVVGWPEGIGHPRFRTAP